MIEVEMMDDIRKFKSKAVGPFTLRQAVCIIIGVLIGAPIAMLVDTTWDNRVFIAVLVSMPIILSGFISIDGCYFEVFILRFMYMKFMTPQKRKTVQKHPYRQYYEKFEKEKQQKMMLAMSPKKQKAYQKMLDDQKKHVIKPSSNPEYKLYK